MKVANTLLILLIAASVPVTGRAQEIPPGVNYKRAPETVNATAKTALERALSSSEDVPSDTFGKVVVCGPMLWRALKPTAPKVLLDNSSPLILMLSLPEPVQAEGKRIMNEEQRQAFWSSLLRMYPGLKGAQARKAKPDEISHYWAQIPFDIEEPFFAIDAGEYRFIAHMTVDHGKPRLFWIDLVGDLKLLRPDSKAELPHASEPAPRTMRGVADDRAPVR